MPVGVNTLAYNSLWQVRNDTWSSLEESATQLALAGARQHPVEQLIETVTGLLDVLGSIERFWAFPGAQASEGAAAVRGGQVRSACRRGGRPTGPWSPIPSAAARSGTCAPKTRHTIAMSIR